LKHLQGPLAEKCVKRRAVIYALERVFYGGADWQNDLA
jgi:hypothetical protein